MDLLSLLIAGAAALSLIPVLFILYALLSDLWSEDEPASWDRIYREHVKGNVIGRRLSSDIYPRLLREMCKASSKKYFQVHSLSKAVIEPSKKAIFESGIVLERNPVEVWHSITRSHEHAEISVCLFNPDGDQLLLTHRLWVN